MINYSKPFAIFIFFLSATFALGGIHPRIKNQIDPVWRIQLSLGEGRKLVSELDEHFGQKSTTSYRREQKAAMAEGELTQVFNTLMKGQPNLGIKPIIFHDREKADTKDDQLPGNFTYYGRAATFKTDGGRKTSIRMRTRIYVKYSKDFTTVTRIPSMTNLAYLELKIKNPNDHEPDGVHKYRIQMKDEDILTLFRANPADPEFSSVIEELIQHALVTNKEPDKEERVRAIFSAISYLAKIDPSFIRPLFVTAYSRKSLAFTEKDYEIPLPSEKVKKKFSNLWGLLGKRPPVTRTKKADAEFQVTMDKNVHGYEAQVLPSDTSLELQRYLSPSFSGIKVQYPDDAVVIELKEPGDVSQLRTSQKSKTHRWIEETLVRSMKLKHFPKFVFNRGKAGHLTRMIRSIQLAPFRSTQSLSQ